MLLKLKDVIDYEYNGKFFPKVSCAAMYYMKNYNGDIIYIGKSSIGHLNSRCRSHRTSSTFFNEVYTIEVTLFNNEVDCGIYELFMISKYKPTYNKDVPFGDSCLGLKDLPRELYYTRGVSWKRSNVKIRLPQNPKKRLSIYRDRYEGKTFGNLTIVKVLRDENIYKVYSNCNLCNSENNLKSLSHVVNLKVKSCGCAINKSPYQLIYNTLEKEFGIPSHTLKIWHKKLNNIKRQYRTKYKKELVLSFTDYIIDIDSLGILPNDLGRKSGKYSFNYLTCKYELVGSP